MGLFRKQVLQQRLQAPNGQPLQLASKRLRRLSISVVVLSSVGIGLLLQQTYAEKVSVTGYTEPARGITKVFAAQVGRVQAVHVVEGQRVAAGDRLVTLDLQRYTQPGPSLETLQVTRLQHELAELTRRQQLLERQQQQQGSAFADQRRAQQTLLPVLAQERSNHRARLALVDERLAALTKLLERRVVTALQVAEVREQRLVLQRAGTALAKQVVQHELSLRELERQEQASRVQSQLLASELKTTQLQLQRQLAERKAAATSEIVAPIAGQVSFLSARRGERVLLDRPVLNLVDPAPKHRIVLLVPARAAAQVQPGQRVSLRYTGLPIQDAPMFWGRVAQISSTPLLPNERSTQISAGANATLAYRARVSLEPINRAGFEMVPGLAVEADVTLRSARLWQWLLRPLRRALGRLSNGARSSDALSWLANEL